MWFDRFRRPRWQHRNPQIRREAVAALSISEPGECAALESLAVDDPSPIVREAAVNRLTGLVLLRRLAQEDSTEQVRTAAGLRYCHLLVEGCEELDTATRIADLQTCKDTVLLAQVARCGREEAIRVAALERLDDPLVLEAVVLNDAVARVRQIAVERIQDALVLERLERQVRRSDQRISRLARERLNRLREHSARQQAAERVRTEVVAALEELVRQVWTPAVSAERQRLLNRWEAQPGEPAAELQHRLAIALEALQQVAQMAVPDEPAAEHSAGSPATQAKAAVEPTPPPATVLDELIARGGEPERAVMEQVQYLLEQAAGQLAAQENDLYSRSRDWLEAASRYHAARAELEATLACAQAADYRTLRTLVDRVCWPQGMPLPSLLQEAQRLIMLHQQGRRERRQQARERHLERLQSQLDEVEEALGEGHLRLARRLLQRAEHLAKGFEGSLPMRFERRLRRTAAQVAELRDWRRFAVLPKQEALCRAMEALAGPNDLSPLERARRIQTLQSEWKATGGSDSPQSRELWACFSRAADQAFEPCRAWFDAEAERRRSNLTERERICSQLAGFVERADWDAISSTALERIRRTAREEWKRYGPVDRERLGPLRQRFEGLMDTVSQRIEAKRSVHHANKVELLKQAQCLLEHSDPEAAAGQAKQLQRQWKALGPARPADERALWKEFRTACDGIFAKRDAQRDRRRMRRDSLLEQAEAFTTRLEAQAGEVRPPELDDLRREGERLRSELQAATQQASREGVHSVDARFEKARRYLDRMLQQITSLKLCQELAELKRLAELTRAWESGTGGPISPADASVLPPWLVEPLQRRWAAIETAEPLPPEPEAARNICVRLEILAGIDSPPEDEALRLELQVKRLSEGMGSGRQPPPQQEMRRLAAQWYSLAGGDALQPRVDAALERIVSGRVEAP